MTLKEVYQPCKEIQLSLPLPWLMPESSVLTPSLSVPEKPYTANWLAGDATVGVSFVLACAIRIICATTNYPFPLLFSSAPLFFDAKVSCRQPGRGRVAGGREGVIITHPNQPD